MNNNMDNTIKQLCNYIKSLETENCVLEKYQAAIA